MEAASCVLLDLSPRTADLNDVYPSRFLNESLSERSPEACFL